MPSHELQSFAYARAGLAAKVSNVLVVIRSNKKTSPSGSAPGRRSAGYFRFEPGDVLLPLPGRDRPDFVD